MKRNILRDNFKLIINMKEISGEVQMMNYTVQTMDIWDDILSWLGGGR